MQITLNEKEIRQAVEAHVRSQITIAPNQLIDIDFTAGRGANGLSATLNITAAAMEKKGKTPFAKPRSVKAEEPEPEAADEGEDDVVVEDAAEDEVDVEGETEVVEEDEPEEEEAPAPKRKGSIFSKAS